MTSRIVTIGPGITATFRLEPLPSGRLVVTGYDLAGSVEQPITADMIRLIRISEVERDANEDRAPSDQMRSDLAALPPLRRVPGMSPEAFSRLVADHFKVWDRYVPRPAAAMAAEWDVKPPTMASWIREARLRGLLPPARRRKG